MDTQSPHDPTRITIGPGETVDRAEFAEFLRKTREQRRITLDQISDETKIAPRHLAALERGDVRTWPGGMYRRAMMRAYAESIGLDKDYAVDQFNRAFVQPQPPPTPDTPIAAAPEPPQPPHVWEAPKPRFEWPTITIPRLPTPRLSLPRVRFPREAVVRMAASQAVRRSVVAVVATVALFTAAGMFWPSRSGVGENPEQFMAADRQAAAPTSQPARDPRPTTPVPAVVPASQVISESKTPPAPVTAASRQVPPSPAPVATSGQDQLETAVPLATEGQIVVTSEPSGARVTINGVGWGSTPLTVRYLPLGSKRVRLTLQGYVSQERVVDLGGTRPNATVIIELRPREDSATERH